MRSLYECRSKNLAIFNPEKQQSQELTASEQLHFEDESVEGTPSERTAGTQSMEATAVVDGLRRGWEEVDGKFQAWITFLFVFFCLILEINKLRLNK